MATTELKIKVIPIAVDEKERKQRRQKIIEAMLKDKNA